MVNNKILFKTIKNINTRVEMAKNNASMREHGIGVVEFQECKLQDVIYVCSRINYKFDFSQRYN